MPIASAPMKNISVTGMRYKMAIRLWSLVRSQEEIVWATLR